MTFAAERWPALVGAAPATGSPGRSTRHPAPVWRLELTKLAGQWRVRAVGVVCLVTPLVAAAGLRSEQATPSDTLFGQWVHTSGWAVPMFLLSWAAQWGLPGMAAILAGDVFSSEDHLGTWRTVLTRSRTRRQLFAGKLAAALLACTIMLALFVGSGMAAAVLGGSRPLVDLSGELLPTGRVAALALASWATQLPPLLAYASLAVMVSVAARNSVIGVGVPILLDLAFQVAALSPIPPGLRAALPVSPFMTWTGLWTSPGSTEPVYVGLLTSAAWLVGCTAVAWAVFRHRDVRA